MHRIDMNLTQAVGIVMTSLLPWSRIDRALSISPLFEPSLEVVCIAKNRAARLNGPGEQGVNGLLLYVLKHV